MPGEDGPGMGIGETEEGGHNLFNVLLAIILM